MSGTTQLSAPSPSSSSSINKYASDYLIPHIPIEDHHQPIRRHSISDNVEIDYTKSSTENHCWKGPNPKSVGKYAGIRSQMDYKYHKHYSAERQHLHDKLIDEALTASDFGTHCCEKLLQNWLVFTAGTMGVGKGYVLQWLADQGLFPLSSYVLVDPDRMRERLPCTKEYVKRNPLTAGNFTQKEVGYISEVLTFIGLQAGRNVLVDGSLRDAAWYIQYVQNLKSEFMELNVGIIYVTASLDTLLQRAKSRGVATGRHVPEEIIHETFEQVPHSVIALAPYADVIATFENDISQSANRCDDELCVIEPVLLNLTYPKLDKKEEIDRELSITSIYHRDRDSSSSGGYSNGNSSSRSSSSSSMKSGGGCSSMSLFNSPRTPRTPRTATTAATTATTSTAAASTTGTSTTASIIGTTTTSATSMRVSPRIAPSTPAADSLTAASIKSLNHDDDDNDNNNNKDDSNVIKDGPLHITTSKSTLASVPLPLPLQLPSTKTTAATATTAATTNHKLLPYTTATSKSTYQKLKNHDSTLPSEFTLPTSIIAPAPAPAGQSAAAGQSEAADGSSTPSQSAAHPIGHTFKYISMLDLEALNPPDSHSHSHNMNTNTNTNNTSATTTSVATAAAASGLKNNNIRNSRSESSFDINGLDMFGDTYSTMTNNPLHEYRNSLSTQTSPTRSDSPLSHTTTATTAIINNITATTSTKPRSNAMLPPVLPFGMPHNSHSHLLSYTPLQLRKVRTKNVHESFLKKLYRHKEGPGDNQWWRDEFTKLFEVTCIIPVYNTGGGGGVGRRSNGSYGSNDNSKPNTRSNSIVMSPRLDHSAALAVAVAAEKGNSSKGHSSSSSGGSSGGSNSSSSSSSTVQR